MTRSTLPLVLAALVGLTFAFSKGVEAASNTGLGTLRGRVLDALDGGWLQSVSVVLDSLERGTVTDFYGYYRLESLPPGLHKVHFAYATYQNKKVDVVVVPDSITRVDIQLEMSFPPVGTATGFGTVFARVPTRRQEVRSLIRGVTFSEIECQTGPGESAAVRRDNERKLRFYRALRSERDKCALRSVVRDERGRKVVRMLVADGWWSRYVEEQSAGGGTREPPRIETPDNVRLVRRLQDVETGGLVELLFSDTLSPPDRLELRVITSRRDTIYF